MKARPDPSPEDPAPFSAVESSAEPPQPSAPIRGTLAHDLNNLLMVIAGAAEDLKLHGSDSARSAADLILKTATSAGLLVRHLQDSGRLFQPRLWVADELLAEVFQALRAVTAPDLEARLELGAGPALFCVDRTQFEQVMLNLAINAREAVRAGGLLIITSSQQTIAEGDPELAAGQYIRVAVQDNGPGMNPEVRERAFEPRFTTKDGADRGLGLASAREALLQNQGTIRLAEDTGQGTRFDVYLPLVSAQRSPAGEKSILLVEDSSELRTLLTNFLLSQGYTVRAVPATDDLLDQMPSWSQEPRLIIADLLLPGTPAVEMVRRLQQSWPGLKAIFISGRSGSSPEMPALPPDATFLQKPFGLQALALLIDRLLGAEASGALPAECG